ncbi:S9 family peptidase [Kribbella sp. NPDC006257]|uniref:S9 family peptidase n=1 Tax=Kribbella sp. NPDC006257 TaxID=3156738 RepID=UPI0033BD711F
MDYSSFDDFLAVPRVNALALSLDGSRLVAAIAEYDEEKAKLVSALWELDPSGAGEPRRLTRSDEGESQPVFAPDGSLLFVSSRSNEDIPALWRLPVNGEAEKIASTPGGISAVRVAAVAGTVVVATSVMPDATDAAEDEKLRKERKDAGVSGILHTSSPVRLWDSELGPDEVRLQLVDGLDLTPTPGRALDDTEFVVTPDGKTVIAKWEVSRVGWNRPTLVAIDVETGKRRVLADVEGAGFSEPAVSHNGRYAVSTRWHDQAHDRLPTVSLLLVDLETGESRDLVTPDVWPELATFSADDQAIFFGAFHHGRHPIFRLELATGEVSQVSEGSFSALQVAPDGSSLYAIQAGYDAPPHPVRIDLATGDVTRLLPEGAGLPGTLKRVQTTVADGTTVEAWLVLPRSDEPAPLLLWVHGGPLSSWGGWSWRWNPWVMAAKGYAVLLPDPALSVGYGQQMIERAWDRWAEVVYEDLMAITDAVAARSEIDAERTAAMGASFGGYMINWIAGQTDRFKCLVSMAGVWNAEDFWASSDMPGYFRAEWGPQEQFPARYAERSPRRFLDRITTPILVTDGSRDQRVPINQTLQLWTELQLAGVESAYLSFPDEGHWILKPANARLWYQTVSTWLTKYLTKPRG